MTSVATAVACALCQGEAGRVSFYVFVGVSLLVIVVVPLVVGLRRRHAARAGSPRQQRDPSAATAERPATHTAVDYDDL